MISENRIILASEYETVVPFADAAVPRHLLISGDSGSGKTATLQNLIESFSALGLPVFCNDVSGDLGGLCQAGSGDASALPEALRDAYRTRAYPVRFWSSGKDAGIPLRVRVGDMGPEILAAMLSLTPAQTNLLATVFRISDEAGLELCDFKDLRAMLKYVNDNRKEYAEQYGTITPTTVGAVQRALQAVESAASDIFGEPALDAEDLLGFSDDGRGVVSLLNAANLAQNPRIYQAVVLWILTSVCEQIAAAAEDSSLSAVFCFDNADALFEGISKDTADKVARVLDILTGKGIGVVFAARCTSSVPAVILAKIGNRIQHRKAVNTPEDKKDIKASAAVIALGSAADTERTISVLENGDAIFSLLADDGFTRETVVAHTLPSESKAGAVKSSVIESIVATDEMTGKYQETVDRETAYEKISEAEAALAKAEAKANGTGAAVLNAAKKTGKSAVSSAVSSVSNSVSTNIVNSITGGKKKSAKEIAAKAAKSALSSTMRNGINSILRGLFGTKKK